MTPNRRQFLHGTTLALGVGLAAGWSPESLAQDSKSPAIPLIDPHLHVWDLKRFRLPWLDNAGPVLKRDYSLADYREAVAGLNVVKSVYVEVSVPAEQREAEARNAIGLCAEPGSPVAAVVVGGVPGSEGFAAYIKLLAKEPRVRGLRCSFPRGQSKNARFLDDLRLLGDLGLSFDLLADASLLAEVADAVETCLGTRFVLDHCGNASPAWFDAGANEANKARARNWRDAVSRIAEHGNVACKISGVAEAGPAEMATPERMAPVVNHCLDRFGPDRVMFASNWPVCLKSITIRKWVEALRGIAAPRGEAYQRKLFADNARAWYRLGE